MTDLGSKAVLVSLNIKQWTARKLDRKITDKVNSEHGASADAGRYNKSLLARDAVAEIVKITGQARTEHYSRTLPWHDEGSRILSSAGYLEYANTMRELGLQFEAAVDRFEANYPAYVEDARRLLNGMFNADDYPDATRIRSRFRFRTNVDPVPSADDFRVALSDAQTSELRAALERRSAEALETAQRDVWQRIADRATHMLEKLRAYAPSTHPDTKTAGIFRDSLVDNIRELVRLLPTLNISGNADLAMMADRLERELCEHDAADLRDSDNLREKTAKAAENILASVSEYLA